MRKLKASYFLLSCTYGNAHVSKKTVSEFNSEICKYTGWKVIKIYNKFLLTRIYSRLKVILTYFINNVRNRNCSYFFVSMGLHQIYGIRNYLKKENKLNVYIFDAWRSKHKEIYNIFEKYKNLKIFFSTKQSSDFFKVNGHKNCYWIPEGLKIENYKYNNYSSKKIDIIQIGRKFDLYHDAIVNYCESNEITYLYEKKKGSLIFQSNADFVNGLADSKISICVPSNITHPLNSGNVSTMTQRYLQSMASKCLILGVIPDDMRILFDYLPIIEIDMENSVEQLEFLLRNYKNYIPLIEKNYDNLASNHMWKNRISDIKKILYS